MSSVKQETLTGVKWSAIERFSVQGIQFFLSILMARLLTPEDFGAIAMLGVFIAVSNSFVDSGFGNALIRKQNRTDVDYSTVFYFNIVVSFLCYVILYFLAPQIAQFYSMPILCPVLRVQALSLILNSLCAIQMTRLTIAIDFKGIAKRSLYSVVISGIAGVVMAYCGMGIWALVYQGILATLINVVFLWTYSKWRPSWLFSRDSFRELFSYGSKLLAAGLLNTIYNNLNPLVIGRYFSAQDLGFYNRGTHFARFPSTNVYDVLQRVTFPVMAKIQDDDEHLIRVYRKYISFTCMSIFFLCTLLAALGKPIILLVLSEKWEASIVYLQIYCFAAMFSHLNPLNTSLLKVKGRSGLLLRLEVIKKAISITILFLSIPFGVIGICVTKVLYCQIAIIVNTYYTGKFFHLGYLAQVKDFIVFFFCSVIACIPAYLVTLTDLPCFVMVAIGIILSTTIYWLMLRKNLVMQETLEIINRKIPFRRKYNKEKNIWKKENCQYH